MAIPLMLHNNIIAYRMRSPFATAVTFNMHILVLICAVPPVSVYYPWCKVLFRQSCKNDVASVGSGSMQYRSRAAQQAVI